MKIFQSSLVFLVLILLPIVFFEDQSSRNWNKKYNAKISIENKYDSVSGELGNCWKNYNNKAENCWNTKILLEGQISLWQNRYNNKCRELVICEKELQHCNNDKNYKVIYYGKK